MDRLFIKEEEDQSPKKEKGKTIWEVKDLVEEQNEHELYTTNHKEK